LTIEEAIRLAQENNPDVLTLTGDVKAAKARLGGASLILQSNPNVTVTSGPRSSDARRGTLDYSVQILQQVEIAGQRGARIDAAAGALAAAEAQLQALRTEVTARARENFGRALAAEQRVQLATEALTIAQQGVSAAEERFRSGAAALLEVNTARVELGRAARERAETERRRAEAFADLRLFMGFDPFQTLNLKGELRSGISPGEADTLVAQALANRADLKASRSALDSAKAEARLASRDWIPSPRIGASYSNEQESNTNVALGVLSFDLPVFNRNTAARGVTAARVNQLEAAREATERRITQEVLTALARLQAARAAADGYAGGVVKAMQENIELVTDSYRAGKIDFLQLVVIRRQAVEARREYIDVLEELNTAQAQLDRALGRSQ
jgi:cobalt-zinc-cadmium efflux system outer membrane protein